jgi:hypothetical protein
MFLPTNFANVNEPLRENKAKGKNKQMVKLSQCFVTLSPKVFFLNFQPSYYWQNSSPGCVLLSIMDHLHWQKLAR